MWQRQWCIGCSSWVEILCPILKSKKPKNLKTFPKNLRLFPALFTACRSERECKTYAGEQMGSHLSILDITNTEKYQKNKNRLMHVKRSAKSVQMVTTTKTDYCGKNKRITDNETGKNKDDETHAIRKHQLQKPNTNYFTRCHMCGEQHIILVRKTSGRVRLFSYTAGMTCTARSVQARLFVLPLSLSSTPTTICQRCCHCCVFSLYLSSCWFILVLFWSEWHLTGSALFHIPPVQLGPRVLCKLGFSVFLFLGLPDLQQFVNDAADVAHVRFYICILVHLFGLSLSAVSQHLLTSLLVPYKMWFSCMYSRWFILFVFFLFLLILLPMP